MALTVNCPACGNPNRLPARSCMYCDRDFGDLPVGGPAPAVSPEQDAEVSARARGIVLTTAPSLEGYRVVETLEIVSSECVFGMHLFQDFFAGLSDVFGGRSQTSQRALRDARQLCLYELRREAASLGADAVIAVALDYSEFGGKGKSMLFLVASGTAVRVERDSRQS